MTQFNPQKEIFGVRFRVTWPYLAGGYPNQQKALEVYHEHQSDLQFQLAKKISESLGNEFSLTSVSANSLEPNGSIELSFSVEGAVSVEVASSQMEGMPSVVRELGTLVKLFFQTHMPGAQAGANLYIVESEFWRSKGWLKKVESQEAANTEVRPLELTTLNEREVEELLTALARKHLRSYILDSAGSELRGNVERILSTLRFLQLVSDRPENVILYKELAKEIEAAPTQPVVNSLRDLGILNALDDVPRLLFANLRQSAIPNHELDLFLRSGIKDPEAELTLLLYKARDFATTSKTPSELLEEAVETLKKQGQKMRKEEGSPAHPKKRKLLNGIGNLLLGFGTAGGNALLITGTIVAPNPATAYLGIGSAAAAVGAIFKGMGDLQGE